MDLLNNKSKRSQVAIFVIIALAIIFVIVLIFSLIKGPDLFPGDEKNPVVFIEDCIKPSLVEAESLINKYGGYVSGQGLSIEYGGYKRAYLCHTSEDKELCISQEPLLRNRIEQEVYNEINQEVEKCFQALEAQYTYYDDKPTNLQIEILPDQLIARINKKVLIGQAESQQSFERFDTLIDSPLFDFTFLVNDIINQEVNCQCGVETCNADIIELIKGNRDYEIERFVDSWNQKVYTLREVNTGKEFFFGIRNCIRFD